MAGEMGHAELRRVRGGLDIPCSLALLASMVSAPFLLPDLDTLHNSLLQINPSAEAAFEGASPFLWTMSLSAMFAALAVLFVCLLKPSFGGFSKGLVIAGGVAYPLGYAMLVASMFWSRNPVLLTQIAGVPLGFGLAIIAMTWMLQVHLPDYRHAIILLTATTFAMSLLDLIYFVLPPAVAPCSMFVMATAGTVGCVVGYLRTERGAHPHRTSGSNWWDVFGKLDMSLVDGAHDYQRPFSRVVFFVVSPSVMLLLLLSSRNIPQDGLTFPLTVAAGLLACFCALPLCAVTVERILVSFSYRLYLPVVAFAVFIVDAFVPAGSEPLTMSVGITTFCALYAILMFSMLVGIASRMGSLVLPMMGILVITISLTALLSYTRVQAGQLAGVWFYVTMGLFVISIILFFITPSSQIWRRVMEGVTAINEKDEVASTMERCDELAREAGLTARETEILRYLARGHGSAFIAAELVVAESTVRTHVKSIYRKIGVTSREELLKLFDTDASAVDEEPRPD